MAFQTKKSILEIQPEWHTMTEKMTKEMEAAIAPYPKPEGLRYEYGTAGVSPSCRVESEIELS